ncbi:MAG: hypothetical protein JSV82_05030 [Planctomycetota bacterium]|nr:MAG: hypothetical protein JSV82_05030 [Planctomycetota bacterium]
MDKLGSKLHAVFKSISGYSKFPIDAEHLRIDTKDGKTLLEFCYLASSESEFDVIGEFFEDTFTLSCDGWYGEFFMDQSPERSAKRILEMLKSIFEGKVRLRVKFAGRTPFQWVILFDEGIDWCVISQVGLLFYNYFGKRRTVVKVNKLIG